MKKLQKKKKKKKKKIGKGVAKIKFMWYNVAITFVDWQDGCLVVSQKQLRRKKK